MTTISGSTTSAPSGALTCSHATLTERLGEHMFGATSGHDAGETEKIEICIEDGLKDVYAEHDWSFFKPIQDLTTTAPYDTGTVTVVDGVVTLTVAGTFPSWAADGIFKIDNGYYSVASLDGDQQITLNDTSVAAAALSTYELGRPEIDLPVAFESIAPDAILHFYPGQNECYPPVHPRHDRQIRSFQQRNPYYDRPVLYSLRTVEFDATVGSRRRLALYPTPDAVYTMRVPMTLRQTRIDATNLYPVGGETLSQVITEACLAAAERNYDGREHVHTKRYKELLPLAIAADQEKSTPMGLGPDAPKDRHRNSSFWNESLIRAHRMGTITLDGDTL